LDSFRTEIENPVVAKDIIDLEQKIFAFKNDLQSPALIIVGHAVIDQVCSLLATSSIPELV